LTHIGLISDTHGYLDPKVFEYFDSCDEIWHAGDFGTIEVSDELEKFKPLKGVYGNIDGTELRKIHPLIQSFEIEGLKILMTHIGGYPGKYSQQVKELLTLKKPDLFICGHSHILRIMRDKNYNNMLFINPGAAGKEGFHKIKTIVRFNLDNRKIDNVEVIELGKRGEILP
jgi:putative phosphoesterase